MFCSLLDDISAGEAKSSWNWFLREVSEMGQFPHNVWFLHVAAVESRLRVHAGRYIPDSIPAVKGYKPGQYCMPEFL